MLYNKRGELTTTQIVTLIVLIASFVIILFLLFRLNLGGTTDVQLCHNSIVQRGSAVTANIVPLNCKTHYICISANNECEDSRMPNPDDVVTVKSEDEMYHALAEEMADCWWMYGEGKVDYLGEADVQEELYCSVCSSVIFDKSVLAELGVTNLNQDTFNLYLTSNNISQGKTYAEYFYNQEIPEGTSITIINPDTNQPYSPFSFDLGKAFYIVTARSGKGTLLEITVTAVVGAIAVVAITLAIVGTGGTILIPITAGLVGVGIGGAGGHAIGTFIESEGNKILIPMLIPQENFKNVPCEDVKSLS